MARKVALAAALCAVVLVLAACNPPPPCTPEDLIPPTITSPGHYSNVGTAPTIGSMTPELLQWDFAPDCMPEHFKILFSPDRHFGFARSGMTDGETVWPPADASYPEMALEPATEYFWKVRGWTQGVNGPDSSTRVFFTGPLCTSAAELGAPELISPDPGEVLSDLFAELHYQVGEPACLPEGYLVDLQTASDFSGTSLLGEFSLPGTYVLTDELADCTTYYWRVAPIFGGAQGPFSETRAFTINVSPTCPMVLSVPDVSLQPGMVLNFCTPEDLTPPDLTWPPPAAEIWLPDMETILPAEFFAWDSIECIPDHYKVLFSHDPDFGIARAGMTDGETTWPSPDAEWPQGPIEPATEYFWNVRAWTDGINGPFSDTRVFFTGPSCATPADLIAPVLSEPDNGAEVPALEVQLHYVPGDPGCIPDGYYIDLQTAADFSGTSLYDSEWSSKHTFFNASGLDDCTTYYWRVAQIEDETFGPFSEGRSFFTNQAGNCAQSLVPEFHAIRDLACYQGPIPGTYPTLGYLLAGESSPIVAQSLNQAWWYIQNLDDQNICAVPKDGGESDGDASGVPIWNNPALPEPETGNGGQGLVCDSYTTQADCVAAGCKWNPYFTTPGGWCSSPP